MGLALVAILVGAGLGSTGGLPLAPTSSLPSETGTEATVDPILTVYVSGLVATPGVVRLPEGAIVADAIAASGGALEGAALEAVNLAAPVTAGEHIHVSGPGETGSVAAASAGNGLISLNQADAAALEALPGVGPVLAERIIAHREEHGPFQSVEDLLEVPGIGEAKLASIRDLVAVP